MSQALNCRLSFEPQRVLAAGSIGATYTAIGTALLHPARMIIIQNLTDATLQFSYNTTIGDTLPLASGDKFVQDISTNMTHQNNLFAPQGTIFYVKEIGTPTTGSVYVTVFYADGVVV